MIGLLVAGALFEVWAIHRVGLAERWRQDEIEFEKFCRALRGES